MIRVIKASNKKNTTEDNSNEKSSTECQLQRRIVDRIVEQKLIIFCDPNYPILWLEQLLRLSVCCFTTTVSIHVHSSVLNMPIQLQTFLREFKKNEKTDITIILIWKIIGIDPVMKLYGTEEIFGQINIARYFNRLIESVHPTLLKYEAVDAIYANKIDSALEQIHLSLHNKNHLKLNGLRRKSKTGFVLDEQSIIDLILDAQ